MEAKLRDAIRRFIKLYKERKDYENDVGWLSITEELAGVQNEIDKLTGQMLKQYRNPTH